MVDWSEREARERAANRTRRARLCVSGRACESEANRAAACVCDRWMEVKWAV